MALDAVSGTTAADSAQSLGQNDFLQLLLTQLQGQDPTKPVNHTEFVAQMAQFSNLAQTQQINDHLAQSITQQAAQQSIGLLTRYVAISTNAGQMTGQVTAIEFDGREDGPKLTVTSGLQAIPGVTLDRVIKVSNTAF
ncbi:MAG TPA: flagellar hook capping FlgD N-terminal domain-containing protein [Paucimonas sp.]|nr:flagellar hook capping FlgD N-terminal domain-containing protein [Paucimonas sp.]